MLSVHNSVNVENIFTQFDDVKHRLCSEGACIYCFKTGHCSMDCHFMPPDHYGQFLDEKIEHFNKDHARTEYALNHGLFGESDLLLPTDIILMILKMIQVFKIDRDYIYNSNNETDDSYEEFRNKLGMIVSAGLPLFDRQVFYNSNAGKEKTVTMMVFIKELKDNKPPFFDGSIMKKALMLSKKCYIKIRYENILSICCCEEVSCNENGPTEPSMIDIDDNGSITYDWLIQCRYPFWNNKYPVTSYYRDGRLVRERFLMDELHRGLYPEDVFYQDEVFNP